MISTFPDISKFTTGKIMALEKVWIMACRISKGRSAEASTGRDGFQVSNVQNFWSSTYQSNRSMQQPGSMFERQPRKRPLAKKAWWRAQRKRSGQKTMVLVCALPLPLGPAAALLRALVSSSVKWLLGPAEVPSVKVEPPKRAGLRNGYPPALSPPLILFRPEGLPPPSHRIAQLLGSQRRSRGQGRAWGEDALGGLLSLLSAAPAAGRRCAALCPSALASTRPHPRGAGGAGAERSQIDFQPQPGHGVSREERLFWLAMP